jgi:hypothetical protein
MTAASLAQFAWILVWPGITIAQSTCPTTLVAGDAAAGDEFGHAVAMHGDLAVIGAWNDDDHGQASGAAYVFRYDGTGWVQEQKLTALDAQASAGFGYAVGTDGAVVVVGAPRLAAYSQAP